MIKRTLGVGSIIAGLISWFTWHSPFWLIVHFILGWIYVVYYITIYVIPWGFVFQVVSIILAIIGVIWFYKKYIKK